MIPQVILPPSVRTRCCSAVERTKQEQAAHSNNNCVKMRTRRPFFISYGAGLVKALVCYQSDLEPVSRKSRELFGPEKLFVKVRPAYSVKLVFSHVVKGIKIKIIAKFRASRRLRFEDTKRIMSPKIHPKSFGIFEKQALGFRFQPRRQIVG